MVGCASKNWMRNFYMKKAIVLKFLDMIDVYVCNGSGVIKEEPPLDLHQVVVWNGGAEAFLLIIAKNAKMTGLAKMVATADMARKSNQPFLLPDGKFRGWGR